MIAGTELVTDRTIANESHLRMFQIKKYVRLCVRIIRIPSVPKLLSSIVFRDAVAKTTTELLLSPIFTVQDMNHFLKLAFLYCNTNNHCSDAILVKNPGPSRRTILYDP